MIRLVAEGLAIRRGGRIVARPNRIALAAGRSLALMGPNGSGKSSLLRVIAGLALPAEGSVHLDGRGVHTLAPGRRAREIACLFQRHQVAFDFSLRELVALGSPQPASPRVDGALARVGLGGLGDRRWSRCSGGEQQRAHLARALVTGARLLLLDEPDNHLDLGARALLARLLAEELDRGCSVILSTHDMDLAATCDEVLLLAGGEERLRGPPLQVFAHPLFPQTFGLGSPSSTGRASRALPPAPGPFPRSLP